MDLKLNAHLGSELKDLIKAGPALQNISSHRHRQKPQKIVPDFGTGGHNFPGPLHTARTYHLFLTDSNGREPRLLKGKVEGEKKKTWREEQVQATWPWSAGFMAR